MCQHAQSNACLDLPARVRPPARWRAPRSASKGLRGGGSAQTADCGHQSAACVAMRWRWRQLRLRPPARQTGGGDGGDGGDADGHSGWWRRLRPARLPARQTGVGHCSDGGGDGP